MEVVMKMGRLARFMKGAEGSIAVLSALAMVGMAGITSLSVDMGHLYTVRNELQNTADSAALAAAGNLIQDSGGVALRNSTAAKTAAQTVAQSQAALLGLPVVAASDRTDLNIIFGEWNLYDPNLTTAWTEIGSDCAPTSNANAVRVTIYRAPDKTYGPITNFFAGIFGAGSQTSTVQASATAYLGYTKSVETGTVTVPVALPQSIITAAEGGTKSWWAKLLGPSEAIASGPYQTTFKDLGSGTFYQSNLQKPQFDTAKAYMVIVNQSDSVPSTVVNNVKRNYTSGTAIRPMERGTRLYPISEYQWAGNINTIFSAFKSAYDAKKSPSSGKWRVCVPVYQNSPVAQKFKEKLIHLARLFSFGPSEAQACFSFWTQTYPGGNVPIYVDGFANVDIVAVNYVSTCDDCSPYAPAANGQSYLSAVDCMVNNSNSCRNTNSLTIEVPVGSSTISPPGSSSGGPSNQVINPAAPANTGAFASIPRLVK